MLSNLTMWDTGTAGSMEGDYALKLASRARSGSLATSIKRLTFRKRGQIQLECLFHLQAGSERIAPVCQ